MEKDLAWLPDQASAGRSTQHLRRMGEIAAAMSCLPILSVDGAAIGVVSGTSFDGDIIGPMPGQPLTANRQFGWWTT
jgi:hypothetical protein